MNPLISIIVPVFNSEKYLDRCAKSILHQSYKNIELILINDGSTDGSLSICKKYELLDPRVKVIDKINGGVSSARNCGMDIATGDLIGFVDSDDCIDKNMYQNLSEIISIGSDASVLISHTINESELINSQIDSISGYDALFHLFRLKFPTSLWAYLYKREIVDQIRLNEELHFFEDFEFNVKILMKSKSIGLCRNSLYNYEINDTSINSQKINRKKTTCLNIYDDLIKIPYIYSDLKLKKSAEYFRAHFLVSIILSASNSLDVPLKEYIILVQKKGAEMLKGILNSTYVPLKYKVVIFFSSLAPSTTIKAINLLKKF